MNKTATQQRAIRDQNEAARIYRMARVEAAWGETPASVRRAVALQKEAARESMFARRIAEHA